MKEVITRLCLVTREKKPKEELIRIVKTPQGVIVIDKNNNIPGRGAYVTKNQECIKLLKKKNLLQKALKCQINEDIYEQLLKEL